MIQSRDDAIEALNKKLSSASRDSDDVRSEFIATRALAEQLTGEAPCRDVCAEMCANSVCWCDIKMGHMSHWEGLGVWFVLMRGRCRKAD